MNTNPFLYMGESKMTKKIILGVIAIGVIGAVLMLAMDGSASKETEFETFAVERGDIVDKALAVGKIEPEKEIAIKSKIGGIVRSVFVEIGSEVSAGDPLFDIAPDPTPLEYTEAKRQVEISQVSFDNAKREFDRVKSLRDKQLISHQEYESKLAVYDEADLRLKLAREKLALIESGKTTIADRSIDNIIKSPISGTILSKNAEEGDPVVPLTSFQAGTELMTLARMDKLLFKGNVDEIDVGKIAEGMSAKIEIGAVPGSEIEGIVRKISPKAHTQDGSTLFEIEIEIDDDGGDFLRAGYSANANIIISESRDILLVPERLITFKDSLATVEVTDTLGTVEVREVKTGLSDGINIEVISGVEEGDLIVERPPKEITAN
jgi:HlyD family secretion protein